MTDKDFKIKSWCVKTTVDDDGHLSIWVSHEDDSGVEAIDCPPDPPENGWSERFTTPKIESDYWPVEEEDE